jgi:ribulose bisphosphate carboxylase small subunit
MIREQVLIIKVRYDDEREKTPHTWNWSEFFGGKQEVEVLNHGAAAAVHSSEFGRETQSL